MDSAKFWDGMADTYDKHAMKIYAQAYADTVMHTRKHLKETDHVLDFACGTGLTTVQLADAVLSIHAVDISPRMIEAARSKSEKAGIKNIAFYCTTLYDERLLDGTYDAVLAFNILFGLPDQKAVFKRIHSLLKPGGIFISATDCLAESLKYRLCIWLMKRLGKVPYEKLYSKESLKMDVMAGGFEIIETRSLYDTPPNLFIAARKA